jgi:hypothetical protein
MAETSFTQVDEVFLLGEWPTGLTGRVATVSHSADISSE